MQISLDRVHRIFHFPDLTTHPVFQCYGPRRVVCAKSLSDIYSAVRGNVFEVHVLSE